MNKNEKVGLVSLAKDILNNNSICIILNYKGLNAEKVTALRRLLKSKKSNIKIIKNTLFKIALENSDFSGLNEYFTDQVAVAYAQDPIALSNVLVKFAQENEGVKISVGLLDGKIVPVSMLVELSKLGSLEEVRAKFIGVLSAPASQLVRTLDAYKNKLSENA